MFECHLRFSNDDEREGSKKVKSHNDGDDGGDDEDADDDGDDHEDADVDDEEDHDHRSLICFSNDNSIRRVKSCAVFPPILECLLL